MLVLNVLILSPLTCHTTDKGFYIYYYTYLGLILTGSSGRSFEGFLIGRPLSRLVDTFATLATGCDGCNGGGGGCGCGGGGGGGGGGLTISGSAVVGVVVSAFLLTPRLALKDSFKI